MTAKKMENLDCTSGFIIREAAPADWQAIRSLQPEFPGAVPWDPILYRCLIATCQNWLASFLFWREVASDEREILNLTTLPPFRRKGLALALVRALLAQGSGVVFLEVRESNEAARKLYRRAGFEEIGRRSGYYQSPPEAAIVMKFHSC